MKKQVTVKEIADVISGEVIRDGGRFVEGVASLESAGPSDLVFVEDARFVEQLESCQAAAAIVSEGITLPERMSGIRFPHPALGMARAVAHLKPRARRFTSVSPQAFVSDSAELGAGVGIGPGAYIGERVKIGSETEIYPGCTVGDDTTVGEDCVLYSGVHVYHECELGDRLILHSGVVIGADGYGFIQEPFPQNPEEPLRHYKVGQVGRVVVEDDVEIGANSAVDRAALDETRIGKGTKIDDLVMVAHNCTIGRHCLLIGQSGTSGSTDFGDYVTMAGQAGVVGHVKIGSRTVIAAQSGVTRSLREGQVVLGSPAFDLREARKAYALIASLPRFKKQLAEHGKRLASLEEK